MSNPINTDGVLGTDGISPIYNPDALWQNWSLDDIYLGTAGANKFVPKVRDLVTQIVGASINQFVVTDINPITLIPTLSIINLNNIGEFSTDDILLGVGPGTQSDTYRVYINKSVTPYILAVDKRLFVGGTMCNWCKIFKGSDISDTGLVISRIYDNNGAVISENVPLELVATRTINNTAIKTVATCYTNEDLVDGEILTAVMYDATGIVVSIRQLLVKNTAFVRSTDASKKYITEISLQSPFLSASDSSLIQYPINVPLPGLNLFGIVSYSDGSSVSYPVDGTKFSIYGFEQYTATSVGQPFDLVLSYSLGPDEVSYNIVPGGNNQISCNYKAVTLNNNGSYNLKLYAFPVWINPISGYRLQWFLYNLDRNIHYDVTTHVSINTNVSVYNPIIYGQVQHLNVAVNLRDVDGALPNYIYTQSVNIALLQPGTARTSNWSVSYAPNQIPPYGLNVHATANFVMLGSYKVTVDSGFASQELWLNALYYNVLPLFNPASELAPPVPTHFNLIINGVSNTYLLSQWNSVFNVLDTIENSSSITLEFIQRTINNDLQLSVASMIVYYVDNSGNFITA